MSRRNGFWTSQEPDDAPATLEVATKIGLIQSEVSELLEAWRLAEPYGECAKDSRLTHLSEEAADVAIRLLDLCHFLRINLVQAIQIKMAYNKTRPYKHSKRF